MKTIYRLQFDACPATAFEFTFESDSLSNITFLPIKKARAGDDKKLPAAITKSFNEYFTKGTRSFDFKIEKLGTPFQQCVWQAMRDIPNGQTRTYGEIAHAINSSAQAVGNACRQNPFPIINPCHRIVAKEGLGGFAGNTRGWLMEVKQWLLNLENSPSFSRRRESRAM